MRSHPDAALAARDPALPGLSGLLDTPALAARAGLPGLGASYLLYKPGTSCIAGLAPADGGLGAWMAATYPATRYEKARAHPPWRNGAIFLDDAQTVLVPLALLRRPKAARALADAERRDRLLSAVGLAGCALRLLRFKPGRRLVLRADGPEGPRAVLKLHACRSDYARAFAGARQSTDDSLRLIGRDTRRRAIATEWVPGAALTAAAPLDAFVRAGAVLAAAHARPALPDLPAFAQHAPDTITKRIDWLLPGLGKAVRDVTARMPPSPEGPAVALHGDFSADQVVDGPEGVRIVDWDRACIGPAARDLGSALASLDLDGLRGADSAEAAGDALLAGYRAAGGAVTDDDVAAWRAYALLARADEGFRTRRPGWNDEAAAVVARVGALLRGAPQPTPHMARALALRPVAGAAPTLLRLKPGRRALIRYGDGILGKLRAKGSDVKAVRAQKGLYEAGLDGRAGVGVPRVLGAWDDPPVWLQEEVEGKPLADLLDAPGAPTAMLRTGAALAALHDVPPQTSRRWSLDDERATLARAVRDGPYADLADLAATSLAALPPAPQVGLHRDFYFDQVIVGPKIVWLVDLDLHARGDAAIDLGNFVAHLTELDLRRGGDGTGFAPLEQAFLAGYAVRRPLPDAARVDLMHWVSLARHVSIARRFADRAHAVPAIAAFCRTRGTSYAIPRSREAI